MIMSIEKLQLPPISADQFVVEIINAVRSVGRMETILGRARADKKCFKNLSERHIGALVILANAAVVNETEITENQIEWLENEDEFENGERDPNVDIDKLEKSIRGIEAALDLNRTLRRETLSNHSAFDFIASTDFWLLLDMMPDFDKAYGELNPVYILNEYFRHYFYDPTLHNPLNGGPLTDETRELLPKLMEFWWKRYNYDLAMHLGITIEDYEFMYSLWSNGLPKYDDDVRDRLNRIRIIYLKHKQ